MSDGDHEPVGRGPELERLTALLDAAVAGRSSTVLLTGPAGIGKTTLLRATARRAVDRHGTALRCRGTEAESDIPFAGLHELLGPILRHVPALPAPHRDTLGVALGLAAGPPPSTFAVAIGLLALLASAPDQDGPILALVDDAQWLDQGSLDAILFVARRLHAENVVLVLAARPDPGRGLADRDLERIDLAPLGDDDARALVRRVAPDRSSAHRLGRILDLAAGSPLALVEIARSSGLPDDGPETWRPTDAIERAFRHELAALPDATRAALVVLAADERASRAETISALGPLGLPADALTAAETAGVVERDGLRWRFRHPLLQAVILHGADAPTRAAAHAALAGTLPEDRAAWHRAAAADGPDEDVAAALERTAAVAASRGDLATAARELRRAVGLSPDPVAASRRALAAGELTLQTGDLPTARTVVEAALAPPPTDPGLRADLERLRGTILGRSGDPDGGGGRLRDHAARLASSDRSRAALLLLGAAPAYWLAGETDRMERVLDDARDVADGHDPTLVAMGGLLRSMVRCARGDAAGAEAILHDSRHVLDRDDLPQPGYEVHGSPAQMSVWAERYDRAERYLDRQIERSRREGAITALVYPLAVRGQLELRRGRPLEALAAGSEALALGTDSRQDLIAALAAAMLAQTDAALGREEDCREHAAIAHRAADRVGAALVAFTADAALGRLELGLGRTDAALVLLERCRSTAERTGLIEPNLNRWAVDHVEALVRADRDADAALARDLLEAAAGRSPTAWTLAAVDRVGALLTTDDDVADARLQAAITRLDDAGDAIEAARVRLDLGARRRRVKRRLAAREPLQQAAERFERSGAGRWADLARDELRATGGPTGERRTVPVDALTPHELRVALLVADGRTNPEVAADLFVSRKTVEHHLSQIYRKLGLRSRTELARELAGVTAPGSPRSG
ncbi:MAG: AAA family ATPase [Solirubrobacteraceae bacterium]